MRRATLPAVLASRAAALEVLPTPVPLAQDPASGPAGPTGPGRRHCRPAGALSARGRVLALTGALSERRTPAVIGAADAGAAADALLRFLRERNYLRERGRPPGRSLLAGGRGRWDAAAAPRVAQRHGPHLPLDTDARIAEALAVRAARRAGCPTAVPGPALRRQRRARGVSWHYLARVGALAAVVVELVRSAARTFSRVVLVSAHGGNLDGVQAAVAVLRAERRDAIGWFPAVAAGDAHAGRTETSILLAIAPRLVRPSPWVAGPTEPLSELLPRLRSVGVRPVSPDGVLGDPAGAGAEEGERLLDVLADQVARLARPPTLETTSCPA